VSDTLTRFRLTFRGRTCITATTVSTWDVRYLPRRPGDASPRTASTVTVSPVLSRLLRGSPARRRRPARPG
jgi:hypothetical protein